MEIALLAKVGGGLACLTGATVGGCYAAGLIGGQGGNGTSEQTDVEPKSADRGTQQTRARETQVRSRGGNANAKRSKPSTWNQKSTTAWDPLEAEKDGYEAQTLGKMYGRYLLGIYGNDENKELQKKQWEDLYKSAIGSEEDEDEEGAGFGDSAFVKRRSKQITTHYSERGGNMSVSLNGMCEELYGKTFEELKQQNSRENTQKKIKDDLFGYCSTISSEPTPNNSNPYSEGNILMEDLLSSNVIVAKEEEKTYNNFWNLQDRWFKALEDEVTDSFFKTYQRLTSSDNLDIKRACEAAYKTKKDAENRPSREDVIKYCTFAVNSQ